MLASDRKVAATYPYRDENGTVLFEVVRFDPKGFAQRRPDGSGGWLWNLGGTRRVIYRLPDLRAKLARKPKRTVFIAEGEKDVETLWKQGLLATTNPGGAGKWRDDYTEQLKAAGAKRVVILPDNDRPGRKHAHAVGRLCQRAGLRAKILRLPGLPPGGDITDWLGNHSKAELLALRRKAGPGLWPAMPLGNHSGSHYGSDNRHESNFKPLRASEFMEQHAQPMKWVWQRYLPEGGLALLSAYMKVGKSTFAYALGLNVSRGAPFLGYRTRAGAVLILAVEEHPRDVRIRLLRFGMASNDAIHIHAGTLKASNATMKEIRRYVRQHEIRLVILDTLARHWNIRDENNNAEVNRRIAPWLSLARRTNAAVLLIHHERKAGGIEGRGIRGASALFGAVDQALQLKRMRGGGRRRTRVLRTLGRYSETPAVLRIAFDGREFHRLGPGDEPGIKDDQKKVWTALASTPQTVKGLAKDSGLTTRRVKRALRVMGGRVRRVGKGVRGDPHKYGRPSRIRFRPRPTPRGRR